jgi:hypothetical protein
MEQNEEDKMRVGAAVAQLVSERDISLVFIYLIDGDTEEKMWANEDDLGSASVSFAARCVYVKAYPVASCHFHDMSDLHHSRILPASQLEDDLFVSAALSMKMIKMNNRPNN